MVAGVEMSDINWVALAVGMLINIVLGFIWFSPKSPTGKIWIRGRGTPMPEKMDPKIMARFIIGMILTTFLFIFVFQHTYLAYRDAYKLDDAKYTMTVVEGLMGGFFTWLGLVMPVQISSVLYEDKPWSFFFVNTGYYLVALLAVGAVFGAMIP